MRPRRIGLLLLTAAALVLASAGPADAVIFNVNNKGDGVDVAPGNGSCATSRGFCTLRAAVMEANSFVGPDTIAFDASLSGASFRLHGAPGENAAAAGDLDITESLTINGNGVANTIIVGGRDRAFDVISGNVNMFGMTIRNGKPDADGGGIRNGGTLTIDLMVVRDSKSPFGGGGVLNTGTMTINRSTISGNTAAQGGGGIENSSPGALTITGSTISGNTAGSGGGGLFNNAGSVTLTNATVASNSTSGGGGGTFASGPHTTSLNNTIVANNTGPDCSHGTFPYTSANGHNLVEDTSGCTLGGTGNITGLDPVLGPLAGNGGPTFTHALLSSSPAIDAVTNNVCPAMDQRAFPRPTDGDGDLTPTCDIGAFEADALVISLGSVLSVGTGDGSGCDGPWTSTETESGTNGDSNMNGVVCTKEGPKGTMHMDDG